MIARPTIPEMDRSPERDAALAAAVEHVPRLGWTRTALRAGLADIGADPEDADMLFPGGAADMIELFFDLADRTMEAVADDPDFAALRMTARVRALVLGRLDALAPQREAVRRAMAVLATPRHGRVAARSLARTVDTVWRLAGDTSTDASWYSKRAMLAGVCVATALFWLRDTDPDATATRAFLDRRLADIGRITRLRRRLEERLPRLGCRSGAAAPA
jgi:ubiquinone biosynthesis protein COQ9